MSNRNTPTTPDPTDPTTAPAGWRLDSDNRTAEICWTAPVYDVEVGHQIYYRGAFVEVTQVAGIDTIGAEDGVRFYFQGMKHDYFVADTAPVYIRA